MKNSEVVAKPAARLHSAVRFRLAVIFAGVVVGFAVVCLRLVQLQVMGNQALQDLAKRQFMKNATTAPYRLPIFDRNGEELAASIPSSSAYARPKLIRDKYSVAKSLARVLGGHHRFWLSKLRGERPFVWLKRQMDTNTSRRIAALNLEGVFLEQENRRVYPNGSLAAHILGFTDIDGHGIAGVEMSLNQELIVESNVTEAMKDGHGKPSYIASKSKQEERAGIFLTIDRRIQHVVEEELEQTLAATGAKSAMGIVLDPFTGELLALGQTPSFDPNEVSRANDANLVNRLVSHRFEPGSTIKVLFAAEAIQDGILTANSPIDCEGGKIKIGNVTVTEAETDHHYGVIPLRRVIRHSSNVGAVKVAQALGAERMISTMNRFGLTSKTNVGVPGENTALPKPASWFKPVNLASAGFGQGISTTPLQLAASYAPFANGGFWVRPKLLLEETAPKKEEARLDIRRVLSLKTVEVMRSMLTEVTEEEGGTGKEAKVPGIRVAGKTGTAQKYEPGVGYKAGSYYSSFIGFLPADRPQFLIAVMVDEPKKPYYASVVAAPLFRRIAERSLQILGKTPRKTIAQQSSPETSVTVLPSAPAPTIEGGEDGKWIMPNLAGVSLREAMSLVGPHVSNFTIQGSGYLTGQSPDAGTIITSQTAVRLSFSPSIARTP